MGRDGGQSPTAHNSLARLTSKYKKLSSSIEELGRAYRKAGYLTMVIAGYIPANSQLAAAIATIVKSLSIGKKLHELMTGQKFSISLKNFEKKFFA